VLDAYGHTPEQAFELLTNCGLKLSTIKRWLHGDSKLTRNEFTEQF